MKEIELNEDQTEKGQEEVSKDHGDLPREWRYVHHHPKDLIIGDSSQGVRTRSVLRDTFDYLVFVSQVEPTSIEEAESDPNWMMAMQEKLNQFERNNIWTLVRRSKENLIIGKK